MPLPEKVPEDILFEDPLREPTRRERRALLGFSTVAFAISLTGLVPSEISALGLKVSPLDKRGLLLILAGVIVYFLIAFIIYALSDYIAWRSSFFSLKDRLDFAHAERQWHAEQEGKEMENVVIGVQPIDRGEKAAVQRVAKPTILARALFDFALPIVVGIAGLGATLLTRAHL